MGYLKQIEDLATGNILLVERPVQAKGDFGWENRNATFTLANTSYGVSPFGNFPAPKAVRKWPWTVGIYGYLKQDAAHDALASAISVGVPQRLVYHHDLGYERVCEAVAYKVSEPYNVQGDFYREHTVEWEMNKPWHERSSVDPTIKCGTGLICGQTLGGGTIVCSYGAPIHGIASSPYNIPTSATDGTVTGVGGVPTYPDFAPIITIVGPVGGSLGFQLRNLSDPYSTSGGGVYLNYTAALGVQGGWILVLDCGAKTAYIHFTGTQKYYSTRQYVTVPPTQGYWMSVIHNIANQWQITCLGTSPVTGGTISVSWNRYYM